MFFVGLKSRAHMDHLRLLRCQGGFTMQLLMIHGSLQMSGGEM
jgi:hypothetical protein